MDNAPGRSSGGGSRGLLATVAGLVLALASPARADVDVTGFWDLHMTSPIVSDFPMTIVQTGTNLSVQISSSPVASGTIDPMTGVFGASTAPGTTLACDSDFLINGVASPDGSFISGTGLVESGFEEPCGVVPFEYTATRSLCGNDVIDPGETCDDGNRIDGDCCSRSCARDAAGTSCAPDSHGCTADVCDAGGTCTHAVQSAGTECRPAIDPICDVAEVCDGASLDCPANVIAPPGTVCRPSTNACDPAEVCHPTFGFCPSQVPQPDGDGDSIPDACDVCPTGLPATDARLQLGTYDGVAGNDKVTLQATIGIEPAAVGLLDPVATGVEIAVVGASTPNVDLRASIPAGAYDPVARAGWRVSRSGTTWTFKSKDPDLAITKLRLRLRPGTSPTVEVKGSGKRLDFATGGTSVAQLAIALDPPGAATCGEIRFDGNFPDPAICEVRKGGKLLDCR